MGVQQHPYIDKSKNIFIKMLQDIGMPKIRELGQYTWHKTKMEYNNNTMRNPILKRDVGSDYAWYYCCMPYSFVLWHIIFGTAIPTSCSILMKMFLLLFHCFSTASPECNHEANAMACYSPILFPLHSVYMIIKKVLTG